MRETKLNKQDGLRYKTFEEFLEATLVCKVPNTGGAFGAYLLGHIHEEIQRGRHTTLPQLPLLKDFAKLPLETRVEHFEQFFKGLGDDALAKQVAFLLVEENSALLPVGVKLTVSYEAIGIAHGITAETL